MKQFTFNYFRQLALVLLAVIGFTSTSYAQDGTEENWTELYSDQLLETAYNTFTTDLPSNKYTQSYFGQVIPSKLFSGLYPMGGVYYMAVKYNIANSGKYKFSYSFVALNGSPTIDLVYFSDADAENQTVVKEGVTLTGVDKVYADVLPGDVVKVESNSFEIETPGEYCFGFQITDPNNVKELYFYDFRLFKVLGSTSEVSLKVEGSGDVYVKNGGQSLDFSKDPVAVEQGTTLTVEAEPHYGYELSAITAGGNDILADKKFTVGENDVEVVVTFAPKEVELVKEVSPAGSGTINVEVKGADGEFAELGENGKLKFDDIFKVSAKEAEGYEPVGNIEVEGAYYDEMAGAYKVTSEEKVTLKAQFKAKGQYTLTTIVEPEGTGSIKVTVKDGEEYVDAGTTLDSGDKIKVAVKAADGYELDGAISVEGATYDETNDYYTVNGSVTVKATFKAKELTLETSVSPAGAGSVTVTVKDENGEFQSLGGTSLNYGDVIKVTAEAASTNYALDEITVEGADYNEADDTYTVTGTDENKVKVVAEFVNTYTVTWTDDAEKGSLTVTYMGETEEVTVESGKTLIPAGTTINVKSAPEKGYGLKSLSYTVGDAEAVDLTGEEPYTFELTGNTTLNAVFDVKDPVLSWSVSGTMSGWGVVKMTAGEDSYTAGNLEDGIGITDISTFKGEKSYPLDTEVTVEAYLFENAPADVVATVTVNDKVVELTDNKYTFKLEDDTKVNVDFSVKTVVEPVTYTVEWTAPAATEGTLVVKNGDDELKSGDKVEEGTTLTVEAKAEQGYKLTALTYTVDKGEAQDIMEAKSFKVTGNTKIAAVFEKDAEEPVTYTVEWTAPAATEGTLVVKNGDDELKSGDKVEEGTTLTVEATPAAGYKLTALTYTVDGSDEAQDIMESKSFKVTGNTEIAAVFEKDGSSINSLSADGIYYNAAEEVLYTASAAMVKVYDLSGRLVLNAENQETVSVAELADGIYTAVVDGKVLKFNK